MINICLIMHSARSDNLGVGALTVSQVEILRAIALRTGIEMHITLLDWKDPREPYVSGPDITLHEISGRDIANPFGVFRLLRQADLVLDIGAGDSFSDIYGPRRLNRMFALKYLTHLARRPLVLAPQTYGPFTRKSSRFLAKLSLNLAVLVAARDAKSAECAQGISGRADIVLASDVALRLPYELSISRGGTRPKVGLNVSGLLMAGGYDSSNQFGLSFSYRDMIGDLIEALQGHPDQPEIHLVPHVISPSQPREDDANASRNLQYRFPFVTVAPSFQAPSEAKSYIAGLDFFAGARMHSCIAAFSGGVPVVPMAYSRKFEGLFGGLGYGHTVDCRTQTSAEVIAAVIAGFEARDVLQQDAGRAAAEGISRLDRYVAALGHLVETLAAEK